VPFHRVARRLDVRPCRRVGRADQVDPYAVRFQEAAQFRHFSAAAVGGNVTHVDDAPRATGRGRRFRDVRGVGNHRVLAGEAVVVAVLGQDQVQVALGQLLRPLDPFGRDRAEPFR
jgi:hypothetical protein